MVALNRRSKAATAAALSKYLRKEGFGGVSYYSSTLGKDNGEIRVEGDGVLCIGASVRYWAPERWMYQVDRGLGEAQDRQADICQVLEESGRYVCKPRGLVWIEERGYSFMIHVETLKYVRSTESEWHTCFPHLR